MDLGIAYTVGVKRRFLPGHRKHKCVYHAHDSQGLELHLVDGSAVFLGNLMVRGYKVYPDYSIAQDKINRLKARARAEAKQQTPPPSPPPSSPGFDLEAEAGFDEILREQVPIQR